MPPPAYSTRFIGAHVPLTATYTVPAGKVAVVRDVDLYYGGSISGASWFIRGNAGQSFAAGIFPATQSGWQSWRGRQVLYGGEDLVVVVEDTMDVTVSGYLLDA